MFYEFLYLLTGLSVGFFEGMSMIGSRMTIWQSHLICNWYKAYQRCLALHKLSWKNADGEASEAHFGTNVTNKSNSTADAVQAVANLKEQLSDHLYFKELKCC